MDVVLSVRISLDIDLCPSKMKSSQKKKLERKAFIRTCSCFVYFILFVHFDVFSHFAMCRFLGMFQVLRIRVDVDVVVTHEY